MVRSRGPASGKPPHAGHSVLVVDDYPSVLEWLTRRLQLDNLRVYAASTGEAALTIAMREQPDLALIDYKLPGMNGIETAAAIRSGGLQIPWILFSAAENEGAQMEARRLGASAVVWSPFDPCAVVRDTINRERARRTAEWSRLLGARRLPQPGTTAGRGAWWILVVCASKEDLTTLQAWADYVDVSYTSLRDVFKRLGIKPHDGRDFMRILRALVQVGGRVEHVEGALALADPRTTDDRINRAGLPRAGAGHPVTFEYFLAHQRFMAADHPLLQALRSLAAQL